MDDNNGVSSYLGSTSVLLTLIIGSAFLIFRYVLSVLRNNQQTNETEDDKRKSAPNVQRNNEQHQQQQHKKKKAADARSAKTEKKKTFKRPWMMTSLNGHTGQVFDMDFSSNGKYLASCADVSVESTEYVEVKTSIEIYGSSAFSSSSNSSSASSCSELDFPNGKPRNLSRRQKKNRRRVVSKLQKASVPSPEVARASEHSPFYRKLRNVPTSEIVRYLESYTLSRDWLLSLGYPIEDTYGRVIVFKPHDVYRKKMVTRFDVNAREFYPSSYKCDGRDSGIASESSSDDDDQPYGYAPYLEEAGGARVAGRTCSRCGIEFYQRVDTLEYVSVETCRYHWGKPMLGYVANTNGPRRGYTCCGKEENSPGCMVNRRHVWTGIEPGFNAFDEGYVKTVPSDGGVGRGAYAIDCEMCFTANGLELTKVTLVSIDGTVMYETLVSPESEIVDYNTRFSGITAGDFADATNVKRLSDVQADLVRFVTADTILVGHGLENDMRALKMVHQRVVDTAVAYPHHRGLPYRRSLKCLASAYLKREVQCGSKGHDSLEDARAAMDLMLNKICQDFSGILNYSYGI